MGCTRKMEGLLKDEKGKVYYCWRSQWPQRCSTSQRPNHSPSHMGSATFFALWFFRYGPNGCQTCGREVPFQVVSVLFTVLVEFYHDSRSINVRKEAPCRESRMSFPWHYPAKTTKQRPGGHPANTVSVRGSVGFERTPSSDSINVLIVLGLQSSCSSSRISLPCSESSRADPLRHPHRHLQPDLVHLWGFQIGRAKTKDTKAPGSSTQLPFSPTRPPFYISDSSNDSQISPGTSTFRAVLGYLPETWSSQTTSSSVRIFRRGAQYLTSNEIHGGSSIGTSTEVSEIPLPYMGHRQDSRGSSIGPMNPSRSNLLRSNFQDRSFYAIDSNHQLPPLSPHRMGRKSRSLLLLRSSATVPASLFPGTTLGSPKSF
ncbi:hypothetical protein BJ742DRAFT_895991 [Cladochytrium replicatum]|nr:hypothetical protein BJ742DRAFT_895991 [Cladochytrium replicatum]